MATTRSAAPHRTWSLVMRVAVAFSVLAAAMGAALYRFAGVSSAPIVVAVAAVGLVIGLALPPTRPRL